MLQERLETTDVCKFDRRLSAGDAATPLLDDASRNILHAIGLNNFENSLNAVEHFLGHLFIADSSQTFNTAANYLAGLLCCFTSLDDDHDGTLSVNELEHHIRLKDDASQACQWLVCHLRTLAEAGLIERMKGDTVSRKDLVAAQYTFIGLDYLHRHFESVLAFCPGSESAISALGLLRFLESRIGVLPKDEYLGLKHLLNYIRALEKCTHHGLHHREIFEISAQLDRFDKEAP